MSGIDLLQELKNMEQHITATLKSDKENELKNMEERLTNNLKDTIDKSMKEAIQSLTSDSAKLISNNPVVQKNRAEIQDLKMENARLTKQVQVLSSEQSKLQHKIIVMEQHSLENSLVFRGISEDITECDYNLREKVYQELAYIFEGEDFPAKLTMAKNMAVKKCKRVSRFSHTRPCPISVEFEHCQDVEYIMENKGYLQRGAYVDREYVPEIERKRRILKAAKLSKDYKKKCRLEDDKVVINGRKYGTDNLDQLPSEIYVFEITSKLDTNCVGFFGALNPLSNFYESKFTVDGIEYISSEQYIQAQKALLFKDEASYNKIMGATNSLDCKNAAQSVRNFDRSIWETSAGPLCKGGLKAKFNQNPYLLDILINKTGNKKLVECANDRLWANGIPLYSDTCLNQQQWISQGLLGKLLEDIRMELSPQQPQCLTITSVADQPQPVGILNHQTPHPPTPPVGADSASLVPSPLNVVTNNESGPLNNITSSEPTIPAKDLKKVPETLPTSPSSASGEVMEIH